MSDLIDRQALLKQIDIDSDGEPGYYGDTWKFIDTIKNMPNVHDLPKDTDTISRQAAIDGKICIRRSNGVEIYDDYAVPVEYLEQLPPVQPEIVPCDYVKACKEATRNSPIDVYVYRNALAELKELGYVLVDMREVTT